MSEDNVKALRMALKAVLATAVEQGLQVDTLCEAAIESMLNDIVFESDDVAEAVIAIEVAADGLHYPLGQSGGGLGPLSDNRFSRMVDHIKLSDQSLAWLVHADFPPLTTEACNFVVGPMNWCAS